MKRAIPALAVLCIVAQLASAQLVAGVVRQSGTLAPLPGVVISLEDSAGRVVGRTMSATDGRYSLGLAENTAQMRALRLGFRPLIIPIAQLRSAGRYDLTMMAVPSLLEPVRVTARANCGRRDDDIATFALLEQVRAGLLQTITERELNPPIFVRMAYVRNFARGTNRIVEQRVQIDSGSDLPVSFQTPVSAATLVRDGFVVDSAGFRLFRAPDAEVLIDTAFANGYCFRLARSETDNSPLLGLAFAPSALRGGQVGIDGTLWVDTAARKLVSMEFQYSGLESPLNTLGAGGSLSFATTASSVAFIDRWSLRLVGVREDTVQYLRNQMVTDALRRSVFVQETGAEIASAVWPDKRQWHARLGTLIVAVGTDSTPFTGRLLSLEGTQYRARIGADGIATFSDLIPGPYELRIVDSSLAPIKYSIPTNTLFTATRDSTLNLSTRMLSAAEFARARCVANRKYTPGDSVFVLGRVLASGNLPVGDAKVSVMGTRANRNEVDIGSYRTGANGLFEFCGQNVGTSLAVKVHSEKLGIAERAGPVTGRLTVVPVKY